MYRIVYVKDVEFGAVMHDFPASDDEGAREKAKGEIEKLKHQYGEDILIRRLQRVEPVSDMQENVTDISF